MGIILDFEQPIAEIDKKINELSKLSQDENIGLSEQIKNLKKIRYELKQKIYRSLSSWQKIKIARHSQRPYFLDYVKLIFKDFMELHGDRVFGDDRSILCGIGMIDDRFVVIVGNQKGRSVEENIFRNFGMAYPEGYRKAIRVMKLAEKFNRPIVVFIDTPGAEPNIAAEERGQAGAIARNLIEMSNLKVPIISIIIGEGGSGGALGIGVSNKVLCLENAYYSVISPEGCASLIFKDKSMVTEAVEAMKITSKDLLGLKVIDEIIKEPIGGAHYDYERMALNIKVAINKYLRHYDGMCHKKIVDERCLRFRNVGIYKDITNLKNKCKKTRKNKVFKKSKKK